MTFSQLKWGILAAAILAIITSLPQAYLCYEQGSEWNGAYAYFDRDEFAYSAYVNALIDGRPRRNNPYTGEDGGAYETLFSIQFIPAYSIAIPARLLGVSASTAFIILVPLITVASTLILFVLLFEITRHAVFSAVGAVGVLSFGVLAAQTPLKLFWAPVLFPFLRRYLPAFPFPFFFAMTLFVWRALIKDSLMYSFASGLTLVVLIYSYFFFWTAAVAWLVALLILWVIARPREYWKVLQVFGVIGLLAVVALIPYLWSLLHRTPVIDRAQLLELTHRPDLLRGPELYGLAIVIFLSRLVTHNLNWQNPRILFLLSFALSPLLVFNHQVVTGHSLQPFHYEQFIANYWILIALVLAVGLMARNLPKRVPIYLAFGSFAVGLILGVHAAAGGLDSNREVDKARRVALKLKDDQGVAFFSGLGTDTLATTASLPVLWSQYSYAFSHVDLSDEKARFYKYLYFSGSSAKDLTILLQRQEYSVRKEVFGADRANPALKINSQPITDHDIEQAAQEFAAFSLAFTREQASTPLLSHAIVLPNDNLSNLDRWYERDAGERVGGYIIYRLQLK